MKVEGPKMPVMRSAVSPSLEPFTLPDVERQASEILTAAHKQADVIRATAQQEGHESGFAEGIEQGRRAGEQTVAEEHARQLEEALTLLRSAAEELGQAREQFHQDQTHQAIALAVAIARRVTKRQAAIDPAVLEANIAAALKLIVNRTETHIAVHPSQRTVLAQAAPRLGLESAGAKIEFSDDPDISPGGCKIFTRDGHVDADLDIQLDRIISELLPEKT